MNDEECGYSEHAVKRFLDDCAYILLRDTPKQARDTQTSYKRLERGRTELCVSQLPPHLCERIAGGALSMQGIPREEIDQYELLLEQADAAAGAAERARRKRADRAQRLDRTTQFDRIEAVRRAHPGCVFHETAVDTDGSFRFRGRLYALDASAGPYASCPTRYGDQYDMDRVRIVTCADGAILFYDQGIRPIDAVSIREIESEPSGKASTQMQSRRNPDE